MMDIGDILWGSVSLAVINFGALGLFWLRAGRGKLKPQSWIRFSVQLFAFSLIGLIEGSLLSSYRLGWFILALGLTLYAVNRIAPKLLGRDPLE